MRCLPYLRRFAQQSIPDDNVVGITVNQGGYAIDGLVVELTLFIDDEDRMFPVLDVDDFNHVATDQLVKFIQAKISAIGREDLLAGFRWYGLVWPSVAPFTG